MLHTASHRPHGFSHGSATTPAGMVTALVVVFFFSLAMLLSSGRLSSGDAGEQYRSAQLLAATGQLGTPVNPPLVTYWNKGPDGLYYEPHDVGALLLMMPGALIDEARGDIDAYRLVRDRYVGRTYGKLITSFLYAAYNTLGVVFIFLLMREFYSTRAAFGLALVFYAGTTFMPYAKTAWDVTPAAASLCAWLYFMARALRPPASLGYFVAAGVALGLACSFRYSLLPFFGMGVLWLLWTERARHKTGFALLLVSLGITMLPAFFYNHIRTGLFLRPAIAADLHLSDSLALNGNPVTGLLGLLASPNMGLFLFAPVLLLALFVFKMRHTLPARQKQLLYAALASGVSYLLMIAHMKNWGHFGWGPRYMVPLLPVLFFAAAPGLLWMWQHARRTAVPLLILSILLNLGPTLINWHVIVGEFPGARPQNSALPYQHIGVWTGIEMSLAGEPLVFPKTNDPQAAMTDAARRFPDLFAMRLIELSPTGKAVGLLWAMLCLGGMLLSLRHILSATAPRQVCGPPQRGRGSAIGQSYRP